MYLGSLASLDGYDYIVYCDIHTRSRAETRGGLPSIQSDVACVMDDQGGWWKVCVRQPIIKSYFPACRPGPLLRRGANLGKSGLRERAFWQMPVDASRGASDVLGRESASSLLASKVTYDIRVKLGR